MTDTHPPRPEDEAQLIELVRSIDVEAPRHLHERIGEMVAAAPQRRTGRARAHEGLRLRVGAAGVAFAAVVVALVLALSGSGSGELGLSQAAAVTLKGATLAAPGQSRSDGAELTASVDGIAFPDWNRRFGWRSAGARSDRIGGRTVRTVFYTDARGRRIGYAIVAGTPAPRIAAGAVKWRSGTEYRLTSLHGAEVVTWTRDGHLCVVSGRGVDGATLLALASWEDGPSAS
jgi:hypothetical protein